MKSVIVLLFLIYPCLQGFSQVSYKTYKISGDLEVIQLTDHILVHVSIADLPGFGRVSSNGMIYFTGNKAMLFDTPVNDAQTATLCNWLRDSLKLQLVAFIPNHWHSDCMGGLGYLQREGIESYANQRTIDIAKVNHLPVPKHGFTDSLQLSLENKAVDCYYVGPAHTLDNIVVWIPDEKVLFAGCMVKSMASATLGNTADGDIKAYPETIGKVLARFSEARFVIPGHGPFGGLELVRHTIALANKSKN